VRDYKTTLRVDHLAKPSSVNLAAAVDHFYRFLELPTPQVAREDLPTQAPRALEPPEQKRFLRAVERCSSVRDRAIALLLFYTGLRISECVALTKAAMSHFIHPNIYNQQHYANSSYNYNI